MKRSIIAGVLLAAIVALTVSRVGASGRRIVRFAATPAWSLENISLLTVPRAEPFFVLLEAPSVLVVAGTDGRERGRRAFVPANMTAATGDPTGDGRDEIVTARGLQDTIIEVLDADLKTVWSAGPLPRFGRPDRVVPVDLDGDGKREVVVADVDGRLAAVDRAGKVRWTFTLPLGPSGDQAAIRGLDDVRANGERHIMIARRAGDLVIIGPKGKVVRRERVAAGIRRARAMDIDGDGQDEVLVGSDGAGLMIVRGDRPLTIVPSTAAAAITEIRRVEADGDPATADVALASKDGDVWVLSRELVLAQGHVEGKVSDLAALDGDADGHFEMWVGLEGGSVIVLDRTGRTVTTIPTSGKVDRIVAAPQPGGGVLAVVAAGDQITGYHLGYERAPAWYGPITTGVIGCAMVAAVVAALGGVRRKPPLDGPAAGPRGTGPEAARQAVERLVQAGAIRPDQAAERLAQLGKPRSR